MEIQKIFSDYYDEERLYSVLMNEDELYLYQSLFSDNAPKRKALDRFGNHDGRLRTAGHLVVLPAGGVGALVGRKAGYKAALEADKEGVLDEEIIRRAGRKGAKMGALAGGAQGVALGAILPAIISKGKMSSGNLLTGLTVGGGIGAGLGSLGGRNSARVKTKGAIKRRNEDQIRDMYDR